MATVFLRKLTVDEYLDREQAAEAAGGRPCEFVNGKVREMPGADWRHNVLVGNLSGAIGQRLRGKSFAVCGSQMRIRAGSAGPFYYPDVTVSPVPPRIAQERGQSLLDPVVIVEVTSPSAERIDRREKLASYGLIESVTDYVIVAQDVARVDHFSREGTRDWQAMVEERLAGKLSFSSLGVELPLAEIYDHVFPEDDPPQDTKEV
ncbi:MAG: Uma2 family endonuclease [Planctomycetota bacterium]|nr:Uma2 family endonuclease [Planctomycetaceae bacterium]MDQ3329533.1 Uma2 family endonuclease [Planctomycetota bacterium]